MNTNKLLLILALLASILVTACKDDGTKIDPNQELLSLDGDNFSAPELPGGTFEGAVRFEAATMAAHAGKKLVSVQYFLQDLPRFCEIRIYEGTNDTVPGPLVYDANVTTGRDANSWNIHELSPALDLSGDDLWIAVRFQHNNPQRTLGCDPGPAVTNGDWLWDEAFQSWDRFRDVSTIDINWNVRGVVE